MIALTLCISVIKKTISNVRISVSLQRVEEPSFSLVKKSWTLHIREAGGAGA